MLTPVKSSRLQFASGDAASSPTIAVAGRRSRPPRKNLFSLTSTDDVDAIPEEPEPITPALSDVDTFPSSRDEEDDRPIIA